MTKIAFIFGLLFSCISFGSIAAEFKASPTTPSKDQRFIISGEIQRGDAQKLAKFIIDNRDWIDTIDLNSPGGNVQEAMIMGEIIRAARLDTIIQPGQTCASACFLLWVNGADRAVFPDRVFKNAKTGNDSYSRLGLHRPYMPIMENNEKSLATQARIMHAVDAYLVSRRVPRRLIDEMMARASNDIYWFTGKDWDEIGLTSFELEELYVAKCSDNRKQLRRQMSLAKQDGNTELSELLRASYARINDCIYDLNSAARNKAINGKFLDILNSK